MPSIYNEMPVKSKQDEINAYDLGLAGNNNTQDNTSIQNNSMQYNNTGNKSEIDFSKPVSLDNKSSKNQAV